ncbi:potassium channel family protein [Nonomuraea sp. NPDC005501]|uniref:potassium channel family protein n=1 Tax=Nonomuraea sp. NPDC005501 TaxID=3156884 RepID=UPI00339F8DF9
MSPYGARMLAWTRTAGAIAVVTGLYFVVPLPQAGPGGGLFQWRSFASLAGLAILTWLLTRQVQRALRPERLLVEQVTMLLTGVNVVVVFFAATYVVMADQFAGIRTRLDALYFAVVTLGTIGYGDIIPVGQAAKAAVIVQTVFDLVIVTSAITIVVSALRPRGRP